MQQLSNPRKLARQKARRTLGLPKAPSGRCAPLPNNLDISNSHTEEERAQRPVGRSLGDDWVVAISMPPTIKGRNLAHLGTRLKSSSYPAITSLRLLHFFLLVEGKVEESRSDRWEHLVCSHFSGIARESRKFRVCIT